MFDVRKRAVGAPVLAALAAVLLGGSFVCARAQTSTSEVVQQAPERDTNSTREARIRRTINETYSHRWEIYGGGGYMRFRSGDQVRRNNEVSWASSASYFFSHKIAAVAQAQGSFGYGNQSGLGLQYAVIPHPQINEYMFMGGGGYRFYGDQNFDAMAVVLAGTGWGVFGGGSKGFTTQELGLWNSGFRPAFSAGVNLDFNLYENLAVRVTPYYMPTMFHSSVTPGTLQDNFGFNAGVLYRFGHQ